MSTLRALLPACATLARGAEAGRGSGPGANLCTHILSAWARAPAALHVIATNAGPTKKH